MSKQTPSPALTRKKLAEIRKTYTLWYRSFFPCGRNLSDDAASWVGPLLSHIKVLDAKLADMKRKSREVEEKMSAAMSKLNTPKRGELRRILSQLLA